MRYAAPFASVLFGHRLWVSQRVGLTKLRLLTSIMVVPHRSPVFTAKALATIDVLSQGRVTVGCGAGWMDEEFKALAIHDRQLVQKLAALLRLADAFDRTHLQLIRQIRIELPVNRIVFHLEIVGPVLHEIHAARLKGDLAEAVFQRDLVFMVDGEELMPHE